MHESETSPQVCFRHEIFQPLFDFRFIKKTLKTDADVICREKDGEPQLLKEVFDQMRINAYDLSVDLLDCHADSNVYHR